MTTLQFIASQSEVPETTWACDWYLSGSSLLRQSLKLMRFNNNSRLMVSELSCRTSNYCLENQEIGCRVKSKPTHLVSEV